MIHSHLDYDWVKAEGTDTVYFRFWVEHGRDFVLKLSGEKNKYTLGITSKDDNIEASMDMIFEDEDVPFVEEFRLDIKNSKCKLVGDDKEVYTGPALQEKMKQVFKFKDYEGLVKILFDKSPVDYKALL